MQISLSLTYQENVNSRTLPATNSVAITFLNVPKLFFLFDFLSFLRSLCLVAYVMSHNQDNFFEKLESGNKEVVKEIKYTIREQFAKVQEPWLINGLYDYYLNTNSVRCMEIFITLREPHPQFLFDRLSDSIRNTKTDLKVRVQALTLLGHIASSQPTWLHKLPEHHLFKDILTFLITENELLPLISALLLLIVLLPMFPSCIGECYLNDIFDIFRRLAAWNSHVPGKLVEDQMIHLQVALYALFLRLYGMYPCNLLAYLRSHFKDKNNPVFCHTIKPMMDTVKMHPSLVTTSKETETTTERWKKMEVHDVIVECERFSLDITDRCPHETCQNTTEFRSRSGTMNSTVGNATANESAYHQQNIRSLASLQMLDSEGTFFSPSQMFQVQTSAITETTGITHRHIQGIINRSNYTASQEGSPPEAAIEATPETTPIRTSESPGMTCKPPPSSPLKILNSDTSNRQRIESPVSQEDEEVSSISVSISKLDSAKRSSRHCDSVLPDFEGSDHYNKDKDDMEQGSPCTVGGLHMPNSESLNNFKKRMRRMRNPSQCHEPDRKEVSTGSSPGNGVTHVNNLIVRRANSCPNMKKSPQIPPKDSRGRPLDETDEDTVSEGLVSNNSNGLDKLSLMSSSTQTEVFWPMPYEHLFLNIFPSLKEESADVKPSLAPSPAPALHEVVEQYKPSLYDILDKYIEKCAASEDNSPSLKDQLQLIHQQFLFEKHRRETHAYRNRRLLSDAKSTRLLEECNSALRDQVQLGQNEIDGLRKQLEDYRREATNDQKTLGDMIRYLKEKCKNLTDENGILKETNRKLELDVASYKTKFNSIDKERQQAEAALLDALAEGKMAREQALAGEKMKQELQRVNRELLLMGELHVKYREKLDKLFSKKQCEEEMRHISEAHREEIKGLQRMIDLKIVTIDAYRSRILDLEHALIAKDEIVATQKRTLTFVNEEREAVLEAVESKYQAQLAINRTLEERILKLNQKLEAEAARRRTHSPDTSSCHEVQVTSMTTATVGLSPQHSSPLSASLASSEGSAAVHELRNMQMYLDQDGS